MPHQVRRQGSPAGDILLRTDSQKPGLVGSCTRRPHGGQVWNQTHPAVLQFTHHAGSGSCPHSRGMHRYGEKTPGVCFLHRKGAVAVKESHKPALSKCQRVNELPSYICSEILSFSSFCDLLEYGWDPFKHRKRKFIENSLPPPSRQALGKWNCAHISLSFCSTKTEETS